MVKSTPDPPEIRLFPTNCQVDPNDCPGAISFFAVRLGIPIPDALSQASEFLRCASASAYELIDSVPPAFRPLVWSIIHLCPGIGGGLCGWAGNRAQALNAQSRLHQLRAVLDLAAARRSDVPAVEVRRWWNELSVIAEEMHDMTIAFQRITQANDALMFVERRRAKGNLTRSELHSLRKLVGPLRKALVNAVEAGWIAVSRG
jgi:hypothetical protein